MGSTKTRATVLEVNQISPCSGSPESEISLPLTFFDTFWFKFHPVERIFFYELTDSTPAFFSSVILPQLKNSLALALLHYIPLAGKLVWPTDAAKPFLFYNPKDNGVSLTVAESDADFHHLSGNGIREAVESHPYTPELLATDTTASIIAIQVTLFPNQGFCIGVSSHHAILDGKSVTMFLKSWAYLCRLFIAEEENPSLPPELTPILDRTIIQDPEGIDMIYLNNWFEIGRRANLGHNFKSLKLYSSFMKVPEPNNVRATFELSRDDINKLRQKVLHGEPENVCNPTNSMHLSSFVLSFAYVAVNMIKARKHERKRNALLGINADCRARLDPPLPANYFGNCVSSQVIETESDLLVQENGLAFTVGALREAIKRFDKGVLEGAKEKLARLLTIDLGSWEGIGVAGSPRFGVYSTDFGYGKPIKVEITSIDRTPGTISMAESRDGNGGVEVGVVRTKHELELFDSLFVNGLKDL